MKNCIIFLNGEYTYSQEFIDSLFNDDTVCLCADGGANFAHKYGKIPSYIIGDLDSVNSEVLNYYETKEVNIVKYNPEKDYTDFELVLQKMEQVEREGNFKFNSVNILGALGKRTDFTLNNIFLMENYKNLIILTENEEIFYKETSFSIENKKKWGFSLIPLDTVIKKLSLKGFKYELDSMDVERKSSRLVSNVIEKNVCNVNFTEGKMIVVLRK
ncbi:thiamine diphosphokinase [Leptotrichia sp. OH3620_COT-345]|uniref:thiamine diphosphokinase n=1 Tax=Leptotrichia sp. OH3620_COT-345 TaxID=2491048 RepID=UPI000F6460A4|nr:thiamine diphosphokinase [Leptotrichia sp. OH3620_COT-345]RRD40680.1 thiamine diphosphokinase [Leptotrichia sp. OH3620_COT-345]